MKSADRVLRILIDTREQRPFPFPPRFTGPEGEWIVETERATLPTGDYSLLGWGCREGEQAGISIETKNDLDECAGNLGKHRERFEAEIQRLALFNVAILLIAQPADGGLVHSLMNHKALIASIDGWAEKWRLTVKYCNGEREAMSYCLDALRRFHSRRVRYAYARPERPEKADPSPLAAISKRDWARTQLELALLRTRLEERELRDCEDERAAEAAPEL